MYSSLFRRVAAIVVTVGLTWTCASAKKPTLPPNLALKAHVTANSEFSGAYKAQFVADGKIPAAGGNKDLNEAWCVKGDTHKHNGELTFEWPQAVTVAEIVYYGRTAWYAEECWKNYEVYAADAGKPIAKGQFERGHGPQSIRLAQPAKARKLLLKFTQSYGGFNPGALEVQIFASPVPKGALPAFQKLPPGPSGGPARPAPRRAPVVKIKESERLKKDLLAGKLGFDTLVVIHRHSIRPTHVYTQHVEGFRAGGGLYLLKPGPDGGELKQLVASPTGQILDCDVSYDGKEILFSWRKTSADAYHVFRVNVDGTGLTQITQGPHHNYNVCWLPDGGIAFLSTRSARFAYCWISPVGLVHRMERDGTKVTRLSANIINDFTPSVLNNGRIIYGRWEYVDKPAIPIQSLWTINPDGTTLAGFYGNRVLSPATFIEPRAIPGSDKVLCVLTAHNGPCRGAIGIIDPVHGDNAQEGIRNLTPEINIGQVNRGSGNHVRGPYENPYPIDGRYFLASRGGTVLVRDYDGTQQAVVIGPKDGLGYYSPQPLRSRPRPPVFRSALHKKETDNWATVFIQDIYQGLLPHVQRGEVKEICVVQEMEKGVRTSVNRRAFGFQFPVISCGATYAAKTVWGYVPLAPDGSASFRVPAGVPIYFMAIDAQGRAVQRMRTFTHLMPGEIQGCIGCHEPRSRTSAPHRPAAMGREVHELQPPEWGLKGFSYGGIVQPVLDKYCVQCHSGVDAPQGLDFSGDLTDYFNVSYEMLARGRKGHGMYDNPYTSWIPTYNGMEANILEITPKAWGSPASKLAEVVLSGHPDPQGSPRFRMDPLSRRRVLVWIDLNVPYYGTPETAYPNLPGCRRMVPKDLDRVLAEVAKRRCASCHKGGKVPRKVYLRVTHPERNSFLVAPLARAAGGNQKCKKPVFLDKDDPDYKKILATFDEILARIKKTPRMDMPGAKPDPHVNRSCQ